MNQYAKIATLVFRIVAVLAGVYATGSLTVFLVAQSVAGMPRDAARAGFGAVIVLGVVALGLFAVSRRLGEFVARFPDGV